MKTKLLRKIRKVHKIMVDKDNNYYYILMSSGLFPGIIIVTEYLKLSDAIQRQHLSIKGELRQIKLKKLIELSPKNKSK